MMLAVVAVILPTNGWAQGTTAGDGSAEAYAAFSENNTVLTFYYDDQKTARNGMSIGPFNAAWEKGWYEHDHVFGITTVRFDQTLANYTGLTSTAYWFSTNSWIRNFEGWENLNTSNVTDMKEMFSGCSFVSIDLSNLNTSKVTNMSLMFYNCGRLRTIYVGDDWTSTNGGNMFWACSNLVGGSGTVYNSSNVDDSYARIDGGDNTPGYLTKKNATESVGPYVILNNSMNNLTFYCDENKRGHTEGAVIDIDQIQQDQLVRSLSDSIRTATFDDSFATYRPTSTASWFYMMSNLNSVRGLEYLVTDDVTTMNSMFIGCTALKSLDLTNFNTSSLTNMSRMFYSCHALTTLDLSSFNTSRVTGMSEAFYYCPQLTTIYVGNEWSTASVTDGSSMFYECRNIKGGLGTQYDDTHTDYTYAHIDGGEDNPGYLTEKGASTGTIWSVVGTVTGGWEADVDMTTTDGVNYTVTVPYVSAGIHYFKIRTNHSWTENYGVDGTQDGENFTVEVSEDNMSIVVNFNAETKQGTYTLELPLYSVLGDFNQWTDSDMTRDNNGVYSVTIDNVAAGSYLYKVRVNHSWDHQYNADGECDGGSQGSAAVVNDGESSVTIYFDPTTKKTSTTYPANSSSYREAYVVLMSNEGSGVSATLYYDTNKANHSEGFATVGLDEILRNQAWVMNLENIQTVTFDTTFVHCTPSSTASWFSNCTKLSQINGIENLNTSSVWSMNNMFYNCQLLTTIDLSHFDTSNVEDMGGVFMSCSSLQELDLSTFNTASVTNMVAMFNGCSALKTIYVGSGWTTAQVGANSGSGMFQECVNLVGGSGTTYNSSYTDATYAHIDGGENNPGYLTDKNAAPSSTVAAPVFTFEGDNLVMSTETQNASIFYKMEDVPDMSDTEVVESLMNHLTVTADGQQSTYYQQPIELTRNVIVKAIAVIDNETGTIASDTTSLAYNYEAWVNLMVAVERGNELYERAKNNSNVQQESLENLQWALEEGNMIYAQRAEMPYFEAQHFAERINEICAEIEAQMNASSTPEPYAVLTGDAESGMTMTFYYDGQKAARGGMDVGIYTQQTYTQRPWHDTAAEVTKVVIDPSFANYTDLTSTACWFFQFSKLTEIEGIENIKTENVTSFEWMFRECSSLTTLDLSSFNPAHLKTIEAMFFGCSGLTSIDISHFNTSEVTHWWGLFSGCSGLTSLDVSHLDTSSAEHFNSVFEDCSNLTSLDVSHFNTSKVVWMTSLFKGCTKLKELDLRNFNTENVEHIYYMFRGCQNLTTLDLSSFNVSKVDDLDQMFAYCYALQNIVVSDQWQTANVTRGSNTFANCYSLVGSAGTAYSSNMADYTYAHVDGGTENPGYLTHRDAPQPYAVLRGDSNTGMTLTYYYDTQRYDRNGMSVGSLVQLWDAGTSTNNLLGRAWEDSIPSITTIVFDDSFANCTSLTNTSYWFYRYPNLMTIVGLTNLKTDNVTNMNSMFRNSYQLTSLDMSGFNTEKVTDMGYMFNGCFGLTTLDLSSFNTENVTNTSGMFANCEGLTSLNLSSFNTPRLQVLQNMFYGCSSLTTLDLSSFNTENATDMHGMFQSCIRLETLDLTNFVTPKVRDFTNMFIGTALKTIYCNNDWDASNLSSTTPSTNMFYGLTNLRGGNGTVYSEEHTGPEYARLDREGVPGYFTGKNAAPSGNAEPYAVLSDNNTVLTFYYDTHKADFTEAMNIPSEGAIPWGNMRDYIQKVVFDSSFDSYLPNSTSYWFNLCSQLSAIEGIEYLHTDNVTDMGCMFRACSKLTSVDVSRFKTDNVTNMSAMFGWCSGLTYVDVSGFNTANVTSMGEMFNGCSGLTELNVTNFNTEKVTNMQSMFNDCTGLTVLDLSSFNTSQVTSMLYMFYGSANLKTIYASDLWSTQSVTVSTMMFGDCRSLVGGMGSSCKNLSYGTSNGTDHTYAHIDGGTENPGYFTRSGEAPWVEPTEKVATPTFSWDGDNLTISTTTEDANILYSITAISDGGEFQSPVAPQSPYPGPFTITGNCTLAAVATKEGMANSDTLTLNYPYESWMRLIETCEKGRYIAQQASGNSNVPQDMLQNLEMRIKVGGEMYSERTAEQQKIDEYAEYLRYLIAEIERLMNEQTSTFDGRVLTVRGSGSIDQAVAQVGGYDYVNSTITAIVWEADVPYYGETAFTNPNLLFYANEATKDQTIRNLIYNGVAESITLTDQGEGNIDFNCPKAFTARYITYQRNFSQQTEIGVSRGWETIALPFTVQRIAHERDMEDGKTNNITPFGTNDDNKHFWLRRMTGNGFQSVQTMEANVPYIISMPNSDAYPAEYNLAGNIYFTAENVEVPATTLVTDEWGEYTMTSTFQRLDAQESVYVLNVGEVRNGYPEGSIFERNYRATRPFEAYTTHRGSSPAPKFFMIGMPGDDGTTGIVTVGVGSPNADTWYDLQGRKLQGKPTRKGVYIQNGKKITVK